MSGSGTPFTLDKLDKTTWLAGLVMMDASLRALTVPPQKTMSARATSLTSTILRLGATGGLLAALVVAEWRQAERDWQRLVELGILGLVVLALLSISGVGFAKAISSAPREQIERITPSLLVLLYAFLFYAYPIGPVLQGALFVLLGWDHLLSMLADRLEGSSTAAHIFFRSLSFIPQIAYFFMVAWVLLVKGIMFYSLAPYLGPFLQFLDRRWMLTAYCVLFCYTLAVIFAQGGLGAILLVILVSGYLVFHSGTTGLGRRSNLSIFLLFVTIMGLVLGILSDAPIHWTAESTAVEWIPSLFQVDTIPGVEMTYTPTTLPVRYEIYFETPTGPFHKVVDVPPEPRDIGLGAALHIKVAGNMRFKRLLYIRRVHADGYKEILRESHILLRALERRDNVFEFWDAWKLGAVNIKLSNPPPVEKERANYLCIFPGQWTLKTSVAGPFNDSLLPVMFMATELSPTHLFADHPVHLMDLVHVRGTTESMTSIGWYYGEAIAKHTGMDLISGPSANPLQRTDPFPSSTDRLRVLRPSRSSAHLPLYVFKRERESTPEWRLVRNTDDIEYKHFPGPE